MNEHKENIIELRNIRSLSGMNFYIPDYQRGYRWTCTQALAMLNDFADFIESGKLGNSSAEGYYCLQPIVVKPMEWRDEKGRIVEGYEVIDGQQRLTTLYLLLSALFYKDNRNRDEVDDFKIFTICYQTRDDSREYLEYIEDDNLRTDKAFACIDFYHMSSVFEAFISELRSHGIGFDRSLIELILGENVSDKDDEEDEDDGGSTESIDKARNVRVIWYEIGEEEKATSENIFTRLNIGKIPLTNAELIKAMFLKKSNFGKITATLEKDREAQQLGIAIQQNKIAEEWNVIEQKLQKDEFWYFLGASSADKEYETRIEFIFDLMAERSKDSENYHTFNHFQKLIKEAGKKRAAENVWKIVKDYFRELEFWYNDRILYHLIGFMIECGLSISEIKNLALKKTVIKNENGEEEILNVRLKKDEFLDAINSQVKIIMSDINLDSLNYGDPKILKVLLLFNIISVVQSSLSDIRFPFDRYKKEKWDQEHIASQTDKDKLEVPGDNLKRKEWINDILYYFTGVRAEDQRDKDGKPITDESVSSEIVIEKVKEYMNSEYNSLNQIKNADSHVERKEELEIISKLLQAKELSLLTSKQRSSSGNKEVYDNILKNLFIKTRKFFNEDRLSEDRKDLLGNLALLNSSINRSYGNAFFAIKRMHIQEKDAEGVFIPTATKSVFMKYYSKRVDNMLVWTNDDATGYMETIRKILKPYLVSHEQ